jgi:hypothetical protein
MLQWPATWATVVLFACLIIRTFQLVFFSAGTMFFSHSKSTNSTFSHDFSTKRTCSVTHPFGPAHQPGLAHLAGSNIYCACSLHRRVPPRTEYLPVKNTDRGTLGRAISRKDPSHQSSEDFWLSRCSHHTLELIGSAPSFDQTWRQNSGQHATLCVNKQMKHPCGVQGHATMECVYMYTKVSLNEDFMEFYGH